MSKSKKNKTNAVLYKEMTIDMKRPKIMLTMLIINLFLVPIALGFFIGVMLSSMAGSGSYRTLAWYLIVMVFVEATLLLFITPAITSGSISLEKERQTLDVLLTTRMTPWEIIKGKYGSQFIFLGLMVISTFPLLAIVFIYGGISFFQLLYLALALLVFIGFISCFGIFFSTLTKNTIVSVILTYIFVLIYFSFTLSLPFVLLGIIDSVNSMLYHDNQVFAMITDRYFINGDFLVMTGTFNPLFMIFDVLGNTIGYNFGDYTSVKGMISLCGTDLMPHFTEKNLLMKLWSPISIIEQVLISLGVLRLSAAILNPVKGKDKKTPVKR